MAVLDAFCSSCGVAFVEGVGWPRTCQSCGATFWKNPIPVAVLVVPVREHDGVGARVGVVVIRRGIEPRRGFLALPGGFITHGESWQEGGVREVAEETGLVLDADRVVLMDVISAPPGLRNSNLLVFGRYPVIAASELPVFVPTDETEALEVLYAPQVLAFPLHTQILERYFRECVGVG